MIEGVQVIDPDWRYLYVNDAVVKQGKTTRDALLGHTMMEMYPGIEHTSLFSSLKRCLVEQQACQIINEFDFPDGSKGWFDLRLEPVPEGTLILSFDITQQKQLEYDLRTLNEELEQRVAQRTKELEDALNRERDLNEMKSAFVSMASHEFRTPLGTILTSTALAEQYHDPEQKEKRDKHFRRIKASVTNLTAILNDFLSLHKLESGKINYNPTLLEAQPYFEDLLEELRLICRDGQQVIHSITYHNPQIYVDGFVLRNIVFNLVSNAIKFSPDATNVEFNVASTPDQLEIMVTDQGIGIPEEDWEKLFGKFFRATNASSIHGTGLGLSIVRQYIDLAGGTISFDSQMQKGTTFRVVIPQ